tara:strand:- start:59 stop:445 length:387 start_codon:yes stop_codon:yes gene_type:complete
MAREFSRGDRVRKALMREISDVIATEVKEPAMLDKIISVTDIDLSKDYSFAKVYLSMLGTDDEKAAVMKVIEEYTPKIRTMVGRRLKLKYTTKLVFFFDDSLERGTRVSELLRQISLEDDTTDSASDD